MGLEKEAIIEFLLGCGSEENNRRILQELKEKPEGEVAEFLKAVQKRTQNALSVDWAALSEDQKADTDASAETNLQD